MFRLVDSGWEEVFRSAAASHADELLIVCPFIKAGPMKRLLEQSGCSSIRVLTRLSERDFFDGVSDTMALEMLLERKASVRGIKHLHAKLFVFGRSSVVAGSANLTEAAWGRNLEFGFASGQPEVIQGCRDYFESLWGRTDTDLDLQTLWAIKARVDKARGSASPGARYNFRDHGHKLEHFIDPAAYDHMPSRSFVKFFGEGSNRASLDLPMIKVVDDDASHFAISYPKSKRPRQIKDGDTVFMGRFVDEDLIIYGRAIAEAHDESRDTANADEIKRRTWREDWPHYVRVHDPEFVAGTLRNGVSMKALMAELGPYCFRSTRDRVLAGETGVKPTSAYQQQPQVELTPQGWAWVTDALQVAFAKHGRLDDALLATLDWPDTALESSTDEETQ